MWPRNRRITLVGLMLIVLLGAGWLLSQDRVQAVGGQQYVAVSTGYSLNTLGLAGLTPDLRPSRGNNLFVFALP